MVKYVNLINSQEKTSPQKSDLINEDFSQPDSNSTYIKIYHGHSKLALRASTKKNRFVKGLCVIPTIYKQASGENVCQNIAADYPMFKKLNHYLLLLLLTKKFPL